MVELLVAAGELFAGLAVGFAGNRRPGPWFPATVTLVTAACVVTAAYASTVPGDCPAGADCEPVTWANWAWLGAALIGLWAIACGMGYAVAGRLREP